MMFLIKFQEYFEKNVLVLLGFYKCIIYIFITSSNTYLLRQLIKDYDKWSNEWHGI